MSIQIVSLPENLTRASIRPDGIYAPLLDGEEVRVHLLSMGHVRTYVARLVDDKVVCSDE